MLRIMSPLVKDTNLFVEVHSKNLLWCDREDDWPSLWSRGPPSTRSGPPSSLRGMPAESGDTARDIEIIFVEELKSTMRLEPYTISEEINA